MNGTEILQMIHLSTFRNFNMPLSILPYEKENGPINMATDFWLFQKYESTNLIFRHYGWEKKEVSFGYGQDWNWVKSQNALDYNLLTRRPTGGGIVHHGNDWTYSLIIPSNHIFYSSPALDHYKEIHFALGRVFEKQGVFTSLMPCPQKNEKRKGIPGNCFLEPVGMDLMNESGLSKIAGAAMKRTKRGILIQGTINLESLVVDKRLFFSNLVKEFENIFSEESRNDRWPEQLHYERNILADSFSSIQWREKRRFP